MEFSCWSWSFSHGKYFSLALIVNALFVWLVTVDVKGKIIVYIKWYKCHTIFMLDSRVCACWTELFQKLPLEKDTCSFETLWKWQLKLAAMVEENWRRSWKKSWKVIELIFEELKRVWTPYNPCLSLPMVLAFFVNGSFGSASGYSLLRVMTYCTSEFNDACLWIKSKDLHSLMLKKRKQEHVIVHNHCSIFFVSGFLLMFSSLTL